MVRKRGTELYSPPKESTRGTQYLQVSVESIYQHVFYIDVIHINIFKYLDLVNQQRLHIHIVYFNIVNQHVDGYLNVVNLQNWSRVLGLGFDCTFGVPLELLHFL